MHASAKKNGELFFETYVKSLNSVTIVDVGSMDVNGSLKEVIPKNSKYIGVDFAEGKGVDKVLKDPYNLPFENNSVDVVVSSSCLEHSELFWLSFIEIIRILKPNGLFYLNAPSNGAFHRYPVDCWRFYPDSGNALVKWAKKNGFNTLLLESFTSNQDNQDLIRWNDYVAVFLKDEKFVNEHPNRIISKIYNFTNGTTFEHKDFLNSQKLSEDQVRLKLIEEFLKGNIKTNK